MGKSKSDYCIYVFVSAIIIGGLGTLILPIFMPGIDALWVTVVAAIIGISIATVLMALQDRSKRIHYRGQA